MSRSFGSIRRIIASACAVLVVATGLVAAGASTMTAPAEAAVAANFNPGYIISDSLFYTANAMSEGEIQAFLEGQAPGACGPYSCLKQYRMDTASKAEYYSDTSGRVECTAYQGAANEPAARIIYKVQQACGISAKVILVTLQKERGFVTKTHPIPADFRVAMGFGCPDTAACDTTYYGLQNQLWMAARQFKVYRAAPAYFNHRAGTTVNVRIHPDAACGTTPVYIHNAATAALYNYTPYQPNAAALANLYGTGDACSSYGNRNFWRMYSDWFGSPIGLVNPIGSLDGVSSPSPGTIQVGGWAFDPDSQDSLSIHVYVDGAFAAGFVANLPRTDVNRAHPGQNGNYGFSTSLAAGMGNHQVCVYALNVSFGQNTLLGCRTIGVAHTSAPQPAPTESAAVYRFWSDTYRGHFYTRSVAERDKLIALQEDVWTYEGVSFGAFGQQMPGTVPLYRFWSATYKGHFYTTSAAERDKVIADYPDNVWAYEMIAYYVYPMSETTVETRPVARFWSPTYLHHFYTPSAAEAEKVRTTSPPHIWTYEAEVFRVANVIPVAAPMPR